MSALSSRPSVLRSALTTLLAPALALGLCAGVAGGCAAQQSPSLRVVAVEKAPAARPVLLVQVTNPERRPIRLQRLEYTFAGAAHVTRGAVQLSRDVAAGAAVIVEVPVELDGQKGPFKLQGSLTALIDRIVRIYPVTAEMPAELPTEAGTQLELAAPAPADAQPATRAPTDAPAPADAPQAR